MDKSLCQMHKFKSPTHILEPEKKLLDWAVKKYFEKTNKKTKQWQLCSLRSWTGPFHQPFLTPCYSPEISHPPFLLYTAKEFLTVHDITGKIILGLEDRAGCRLRQEREWLNLTQSMWWKEKEQYKLKGRVCFPTVLVGTLPLFP